MKKFTVLLVAALLGFASSNLFAGGVKKFKSKCGSCHTLKVDGKKVAKGTGGPELTAIAKKRPVEFLKAYMKNPRKARKAFPKIYKENIKGKYSFNMPKVSLSDKDAEAIIKILK